MMKSLNRVHGILLSLSLILAFFTSFTIVRANPALVPPSELLNGCWVDYAPTNFAPPQFYPDATSIGLDLDVLKSVGFTGIVTYGSESSLGTIVPYLASSKGLKVIMGIYNPDRSQLREQKAYQNAVDAKDYVVGYVVGNEGLNTRYSLQILTGTMDALRTATGKPVTTSERGGDYLPPNDNTLLNLGDWVFPNVHPFYAIPPIIDPDLAAVWTEQIYDEMDALTTQEIVFKEVGLPSAGALHLNEANQAEYYRKLRWETHVKFAYFEAFDQPWKNYIGAVEPYWGMFTTHRAQKNVRQYLCGGAPTLISPADGRMTTDNQPDFRWTNTLASKYKMELYTTTLPNEPVVFGKILTYRPPCPLVARTYHWRVRALDKNNFEMDWSPTFSLTIQSPLRASPPRNYYTDPIATLTWNPINWATEYEVQVGCNLNSPLQDTVVTPDQLWITTSPLITGFYNWRVRGKHTDGTWGSWSAAETFVIDIP